MQVEESRAARDAIKAKIDNAVNSSSELPELERRVTQTEQGLEKARRYLPPSIEFDEVLSATGMLEKELGVQVMKFVPGIETQPNPDIRYAEVPVEITVKADFNRVMQFFDRLVHMEKLTHLRNITFESTMKE